MTRKTTPSRSGRASSRSGRGAGRSSGADAHRGSEAGTGLYHLVEGGAGGPRSVLAETGGGGIDQSGIDLLAGLVAEAQSCQCRRTHIGEQDVRRDYQALQYGFSVRMLEIQRQAALVSIHRHELSGHAPIAELTAVAPRVSRQRLDLDDFGAPITQGLAGVRTVQHAGQIQNRDTSERT